MKSKNPKTKAVHALSGRKVGPLKFYETLCGKSTGLIWTTADEEPVTCLKCKAEMTNKRIIANGTR